jgi:HD-GYP domain-containing protein (c-di-GMP phosphodiesterase class II)
MAQLIVAEAFALPREGVTLPVEKRQQGIPLASDSRKVFVPHAAHYRARPAPSKEQLVDLRLADLLVGLSGVTDLGMGQPQGSAVRVCFLATALARSMDLPDSDVRDVYYAALLQHIGCTAYSHESARLFADETSVKQATLVTNFNDVRDILFGYLPAITRDAPAGARAQTLRSALLHARSITDSYSLSGCEVGAGIARRLNLSAGVQQALLHVFEWWNGKGRPRKLRGDDISLATRVTHVAGYAVLFQRLGGVDAAVAAVDDRSGGYLDPAMVAHFRAHATQLLGELDATDVLEVLPQTEPAPHLVVADSQVDEVLRTFGDVIDLKAPCFHGHSTEVATLAAGAARTLGLSEADAAAARRAGLVHDLGRVAIANGVWERDGALRSDEWGQVHLHPYYSEQILRKAKPLADLASLAGAHHERIDGSGYYRRANASSLPMVARIVAAADCYQAMTQLRPHRPAHSAERSAAELQSAARDGALDNDAVEAVLTIAGHPPARVRRQWPAGLSDRQVEVLRLMAEGLSNQQIAARLFITPRTAEHHVQDAYQKIGVSSRAAAALFAMEHDLLRPKDW